jgi:hypothetical protein
MKADYEAIRIRLLSAFFVLRHRQLLRVEKALDEVARRHGLSLDEIIGRLEWRRRARRLSGEMTEARTVLTQGFAKSVLSDTLGACDWPPFWR